MAPRRRRYDVHPKGDRFLMLDQGHTGASHSTIRIVENWFADLAEKTDSE